MCHLFLAGSVKGAEREVFVTNGVESEPLETFSMKFELQKCIHEVALAVYVTLQAYYAATGQ